MAHGEVPAPTDGRRLVAVFASPVAMQLVHLAAHVGFECLVLDPEHDLDGATTVRTAADAGLDDRTDVVVTDHDRPELGDVLAAVLGARRPAGSASWAAPATPRRTSPRSPSAASRRRSSRGCTGRSGSTSARGRRPRSPSRRSPGCSPTARAARAGSTRRVRVVSLAGGIGGARFLRGLQAAVPDAELTVVVNTGDDITMYGLRICPDLDTVMYTLGGGIDEERGWGRQDETFHAREELQAYDVPTAWFGLGDRDLATHLVRRQMLDAGYPLSQVTQALCARWQPGARLLPMSDDRVETHVRVRTDGGERVIHFQEWWVRHRAALPASAIVAVGAEQVDTRAGRARGDRRGRRRRAAAEQPGRQHRHGPAGARHRRRRCARRPSSASRRSSAARRCAAWPTPA